MKLLVIKNIADSIEAIKAALPINIKSFIVVESVADAYRLARELPDIKSINLGGTKVREGSQNIAKAINLLADEMTQLRAGGWRSRDRNWLVK